MSLDEYDYVWRWRRIGAICQEAKELHEDDFISEEEQVEDFGFNSSVTFHLIFFH